MLWYYFMTHFESHPHAPVLRGGSSRAASARAVLQLEERQPRGLCARIVVADGEGAYRLQGCPGPDGEPWRLITLEPALQDWLAAGASADPVSLVGCANPWGPWLRVSRLAA